MPAAADTTVPDVPELLWGAWRRVSIENADGSADTSSTVMWLQLESVMADLRLSAEQAELSTRGSLAQCSVADLQLLAESESSSGYTTCTPIERSVAENDGDVRTAIAEWFAPPTGVAFQPVTAYPEPGHLEWNADGSVMIERAPSGAYVEEWHRIGNSSSPLTHSRLADGSQLYRTGSVAMLVRDRPTPIPYMARLSDLIEEAGSDRSAIEALVDCEFSFAEQIGDDFIITASTLPWKNGEVLDVSI